MLHEDNLDEMINKNLAKLEITYEGEKLSNWKDYCAYFQQFDDWIIKEDGRDISKRVRNPLKQKINYWYDVEIEDLLAERIDDSWVKISNYLNGEIYSSKTTSKLEKHKKEIVEFLLVQYFRTPFKKNLLRGLDVVFDIFERASKGTGLEGEISTMERCHWLKSLEMFLENKDGGELERYNYIMQSYDLLIKGKLTFLINGEGNFITSDNPATIILDNTWLNGLYMPLTPRIMVFIARNTGEFDKNHYNIIDVDLKHVCSLNNIVLKNSNKYVYSNRVSLKGVVGDSVSKEEWIEYLNEKLRVRGAMF